MTSYPAFCDHILHQNELVAAGICNGDTWNLIFINNMLGEILKLSPGRMDDEPFLPRLTRCGFDEVEESLSEPHGGELIAHHKEGSMYIIRWKSVSIDDSAGGEQVRLITMSKIPVDQINRVAELPWQELTVLLDSIHDGIWVIDSDGITLRVNKAMERIARAARRGSHRQARDRTHAQGALRNLRHPARSHRKTLGHHVRRLFQRQALPEHQHAHF